MSGLIFVALAIAWAVYLVPKALKHHEEGSATRSVERFSHTMRVLARREPINRSTARLVVPGAKTDAQSHAAQSDAGQSVAQADERPARPQPSPRARREAARLAARRRRRVLGTLLLGLIVVGALAIASIIHPAYLAIPSALIVAWLVACRLMVRKERAAVVPGVRRPIDIPVAPVEIDDDEETGFVEAVADEIELGPDSDSNVATAPSGSDWDPVPVTLPTYVAKAPAARRSVSAIDLGATGVWTSGRTEADASLAREADEAAKARRDRDRGEGSRAVGS